MKKHLLLFALLLFFITQTKAQTSVYHPFPDSNATWCCSSGTCTDPVCSSRAAKYQLIGKVQIGSFIYSRLAHYELSKNGDCQYTGCECCANAYVSIDTTTYYIRQDVGLKKVWLYDPTAHKDTIFYDFNLHVGDTLDRSKVNWADPYNAPKIITSIDSILINGEYRTRYNYGKGCFMGASDTSMIEGIGSLHGLMYEPSCFEYGASLTEFVQDNNLLYGDTTNNRFRPNCPDYTLGMNKEVVIENPILISPNPAANQLTIHTSSLHANEAVVVSIMNVLGEIVLEEKLKWSGETSMNVKTLSTGIYFLQLRSESGNVVKRFIKE